MHFGQTNRSRSLLGLPDRSQRDEASRLAQAQSEQLLEKDNDQGLDQLASVSGRVLEIARDIESGIKTSNDLLVSTDSAFDQVQGVLKGSMKKLNSITEQAGSRHMCYLILFVVFVFLVVYFIVTRTASS